MGRAAFVGFLSLALCAPAIALAQDATTPKVDPARIDDVPVVPGETFEQALARFDNFSWRAFIALNWPALTGAADRGKPDTSKKLDSAGPRVWETYKARHEVFLPNAVKPEDWESYAGQNPCGAGVTNQTKTLSAYTKFADFNQADKEIGKIASPLVAQNRTYTRYEVRFNKEQFDTIFGKEWYVKKKLPDKDNPGRFKDGSIEVKAAWRILNQNDAQAVRERFYVVKDAVVFDPVKSQAAGAIVCDKQDIALVGLHIVIKTPLRPQWIWSSFEHIDNVPPIGTGPSREPDAKEAGVPYSYNSDPPKLMISPPPPGITPTDKPNPDPDPSPVLRKVKIHSQTMMTNKAYWALNEIKGTIWEKYMLVMTQWPTKTAPESPTNPGNPSPQGVTNLANTTMETYHQNMSCMECHQLASNKFGRDFVAFMAVDATDPPIHALMGAVLPQTPAVAPLAPGFANQPFNAPLQLDADPALEELREILRKNRSAN